MANFYESRSDASKTYGPSRRKNQPVDIPHGFNEGFKKPEPRCDLPFRIDESRKIYDPGHSPNLRAR